MSLNTVINYLCKYLIGGITELSLSIKIGFKNTELGLT